MYMQKSSHQLEHASTLSFGAVSLTGTSILAAFSTILDDSLGGSSGVGACDEVRARLSAKQQALYMRHAWVRLMAIHPRSLVSAASALTDRRYHEIADETMDNLVDNLEALQEEIGDADFDVEYSVSAVPWCCSSTSASASGILTR